MTIPGRTAPGTSGIIITGTTPGSVPGITVPGTMTPGMTTGLIGTVPGATITTSAGAFITIRPGPSGTIPFTMVPGITDPVLIIGVADMASAPIPDGISVQTTRIRAISRHGAELPVRQAAA